MDLLKRTAEIIKAYNDPVYFAESPYFLGVKLFPKQAEIISEFYRQNKRELVVVAGNKSGKTTLAAVIALYEAFRLLILPDPAKHYNLLPGEPIFIVVVAVSEEQGRDTIFSRIKSLLLQSKFFYEFQPQFKLDEIRFRKNVRILCGPSTSASLVGRTVKACVFDELARFEESSSKRGAWNVYSSLKKMTSIFPDGKVICISSPRHTQDIIMTLYNMSKQFPDMIGFQYATWEMNPHITFDRLRDELAKDPIRFWTDYGAKPMEAVAPFLPEDVLQVDPDLPNYLQMLAHKETFQPEQGVYSLAGDPAVTRDSFGVALCKRDGDHFSIIGTYRFQPPVDPVSVSELITSAVKLFHPQKVVFDNWQYPELHNEIRRLGTPVENHVVTLEDYEYFRELCYRRKVSLCNDPIAINEFRNLRVKNARRVDHPPGGSKDVADAIVNSIWALRQTIKIPLNMVKVV